LKNDARFPNKIIRKPTIDSTAVATKPEALKLPEVIDDSDPEPSAIPAKIKIPPRMSQIML